MKHRVSCKLLYRRLARCCAVACIAMASLAHAAEQHGQVTFNGLPVSGAIITASHARNAQGAQTFTAVSDQQGNYSFPDLPDGSWKINVEMSFFATLEQTITVAPTSAGMINPGIRWELKMLPLDQVLAKVRLVPAENKPSLEAVATPAKTDASKPAKPESPRPPETASESSDGFLVNGSVNNAATSQFTIAPGFGNTRKGATSLYTGGLAVILDNSALDARPYALAGLSTPKSNYNLLTAVVTLGGPIRIPHMLPRGPNFFVAYEWTRNNSAYTLSGLVPTIAQRALTPVDPIAEDLLALYPLPNVKDNANYNYQTGVLSGSNQDAMQLHLDKAIGHRDEFYGGFSFQSRRSDNASLFHFHDTTDGLGLYGTVSWQHRLNRGFFSTLGYTFSRYRTLVNPYFAGRNNFGGDDGIQGTDTSPTDWGPPTLSFSSGISTLYDAQSEFNRNRTEQFSPSIASYRAHHNIAAGFDFRRQEFNYLSQENPRGSFVFTGAVSGVSDFADFIQGTPDTASIAYENPDKYLRESVYDAYATDDWRIRPELTLNVGVRWEYGAPITELKNRLVNLDVANGFTAVAPVLASDPVGSLTGQHYPTSLLRPDRGAVEPRIGVSWRPIAGSSVVVRAGYGIYADTSVYQTTALQLATQSRLITQPLLSTTFSAQYSADCPLTLSTGLVRKACTATTPNTFGVDPNFRVGYAQTWQVSVQRDLPAALQMTATYLGVEGANGVQEFLPNTYALGAANPCPSCPSGFVYRASNGGSNRQAGSLQLRRRLRSGFTASALYTYSKSIDDDSVLGGQGSASTGATTQDTSGGSIAQNWRDLHAERGLSTFDQRHLLTSTIQYTSGMGINGGTLLTGWRGRILKEWAVAGQFSAGSGLPETPVLLAATNGSGVTGSLRPDRAIGSAGRAPAGHFLNANSYASPSSGDFGDAGRDSITGPGTFTLNASLSRTFRIQKRFNLDIRVEANNLLNHVVYSSYNSTLSPPACVINPAIPCPGTPATPPPLADTSPLFGLPASANSMRSLQTTARLRF
jgi:hypothetical protein